MSTVRNAARAAWQRRDLAAIDDPFTRHPASYADAMRAGAIRAIVTRARDGDTFVALLDRGFDDTSRRAIRVADYYAPELGEPGGAEALAALAGFEGHGVLLRPRRTAADAARMSFDRMVCDVFLVTGIPGMMLDLKRALIDILTAADPPAPPPEQVP